MNLFCPKKLNTTILFLAIFISLPTFLYAAAPNAASPVQQEISNQLKINHWTLFNSTDEQIRIDTAVELLENPAPAARGILLDALNSTDNIGATSSVCKALCVFRSSPQFIPNRESFLVPLINILKAPNAEAARLAAQATLVFSYREIKNNLDQIIKSSEMPDYAKKNAIYALEIRPDKDAILQLIDLLSVDNPVVSSVAAQALQEWMPIGTDKQQWQRIRRDVEKGRIDIIRERLLSGEDRISRLNDEVSKWQKKYLASLDNIYLAMADENLRAKFVAENLIFDNSLIKLWAIEKINMWQKSGKPLPLDVLDKPLIALISDHEPQVRLSAAKLLGLLTNINSANALFSQLKVEIYPEVKTEILVALSHVCNFALSPGADVEIDPQIRIATLDISLEFFKDDQPVVAAEVIRNLLLQDGLESSRVKHYFEFIAADYGKTDDEQVRIRLLEEMARLCGNDSYYKTVAGEVFNNIFLQATDDKSDLIAAPAVSGLLRVNQAVSFEMLKSKGFTSHSSIAVRGELISAAGQIGTGQDLEWLAAIAASSTSEDERQEASDAMMSIFQFCKTDVLVSWARHLSGQAKSNKDDVLFTRVTLLFETAEKKADAEHDANTLASVRRMLADHYASASMYAQAAKYYGTLLLVTTDPNEKERLTAKLLDADLRDGQTESARQLLANILLTADAGANKEIAIVLDKYFMENKSEQNARKIFLSLESIQVSDAKKYPLWTAGLAKWRTLLKIKSPPAEPAGQNVPDTALHNSKKEAAAAH